MAGSIKWMNYTSDGGTLYATLIDESNGEAGGFSDVTGTGDGVQIPKYLKMRYVNAVSAAGVKRKFYIGTVDNTLYTDGGSITSGGVVFNITSSRGEKTRKVLALDTAQDDGDAT